MANWWDKTWSPCTGCTPESPGCDNCWACRMSQRLKGRYGYPLDDPFAVTLHPDRLPRPFGWRKPKRIAVNLMGDLFHEAVPDDFIADVFGVMAACPQHTFMVLTKRAQRACEWFNNPASFGLESTAETVARCGEHHAGIVWDDRGDDPVNYSYVASIGDVSNRRPWPGWPLPNVLFGVTTEDQQRAEERIPLLLQIPAAVRFLSVEPMLSELDVRCWLTAPYQKLIGDDGTDSLANGLDGVICGGESGSKARPMHPAWALSLRDQCADTQTPFLFKQWGEWAPWHTTSLKDGMERCADSTKRRVNVAFDGSTGGNPHRPGDYTMYRLGKEAAGRQLDGRIHDEYPRGAG
jgi:protein gp37